MPWSARAVSTVRGTVQADILKEDQGQNTCIFSTEFSLKVMGDIQEYFVEHDVQNFYSVSISGYHIAEAARTRSRSSPHPGQRVHFVEAYLARGMKIDDFAPNLSFSSATAWNRSTRFWGASRGASGPWRCATGTARTSAAKSSSSIRRPPALAPRSGDRLQRHPHHASGTDFHLRQHQLAPYQRL